MSFRGEQQEHGCQMDFKDGDHHLGYTDQLLCHFKALASDGSHILESAG
jgi:hypothetical protein